MAWTATIGRRRRASLVTLGAMIGVMALVSGAWACTAHQGNIWFCGNATACASLGSPKSFPAGSTAWVNGTGLATFSTTHTLRYVATALGQDAPCMLSPTTLGQVTVSGTGNLSPTAVTLPDLAGGEWTACTTIISTSQSPQNIITASAHTNFTTT